MSSWGLKHSVCDASSIDNVLDVLRAALEQSNEVLLWVESPSNPLLKVCDIVAISAAVRDLIKPYPVQPKVRLLVDATWMT